MLFGHYMCLTLHKALQVKHETLTSTMERLQNELAACERGVEATRDKAAHAAEELAKLENAQTCMDEQLQQCARQRKALDSEAAATDKAITKVNTQNAEVEEKILEVLGEHVTVEKGTGGAAKQIQALRKQVCLDPFVQA